MALNKDGRLVLYLEVENSSSSGVFHYHLVYDENFLTDRRFRALNASGDHLSPQHYPPVTPLPVNRLPEGTKVHIDEHEGHRYWHLCTTLTTRVHHLCNFVEGRTHLFVLSIETNDRRFLQVLHTKFTIGKDREKKEGVIYRMVYVKNGEQ